MFMDTSQISGLHKHYSVSHFLEVKLGLDHICAKIDYAISVH